MLTILLAVSLGAQEPNCATATSQPDLNACASPDFARADDALNGQWQRTLDAMRRRDRDDTPAPDGTTYEQRLIAAQRAWIGFRDAHCDSAWYGTMGAQLDYTLNIHCRTELTEQRTAQLADLARER